VTSRDGKSTNPKGKIDKSMNALIGREESLNSRIFRIVFLGSEAGRKTLDGKKSIETPKSQSRSS